MNQKRGGAKFRQGQGIMVSFTQYLSIYTNVHEFYNNLLTQFKNCIHGLKEPLIIRGKPLGQLGDPSDQIGANVLVPRLPKVGNQTLGDHHDIHRIGHLEEKIQRLCANVCVLWCIQMYMCTQYFVEFKDNSFSSRLGFYSIQYMYMY